MVELSTPPKKNTWGLAHAWYPEYLEGHPADDFQAKIRFLKRYGMTTFICSFDELDRMSKERRQDLFAAIEAEAMEVSPHFTCCSMAASADERKREAQRIAGQIDTYALSLRAPLIACTAGDSYRYDRIMSFEEKVARFAEFLGPIVATAADIRVAIENHADYYVSEIVKIIQAVPGLGLLFDTANSLHIGEHPYKAAADAAPYTMGTHFKDHVMTRGSAPPLHYEIEGCALGEGDAMLAKCYREILDKSPYADRLVMLIELFKGEKEDSLECWEKSVKFINQLIAGDV